MYDVELRSREINLYWTRDVPAPGTFLALFHPIEARNNLRLSRIDFNPTFSNIRRLLWSECSVCRVQLLILRRLYLIVFRPQGEATYGNNKM